MALLLPEDPPPVEFRHRNGKRPVMLVCDHASRAVPKRLGNLGLSDTELRRHIGWDIGAAAVTRRLAPLLDAPAILSGYSRLVVDCNRHPDDPTSIPPVSDGTVVPGNQDLDRAAREARRRAIADPYHAAIDAALARMRDPALLAIHSFTPSMGGKARPWHIGILWDQDGRIALPLLAALRAEAGLVVGDNQPYSAREPAGYTVRRHAEERGLRHVGIELRQDLVADDAGAEEWAQRLARVLLPILAAEPAPSQS
jgi:predicted N-formylglutamate amidohydrolase